MLPCSVNTQLQFPLRIACESGLGCGFVTLIIRSTTWSLLGICLAPTFELALQIGDVARKMAKYMKTVKIRVLVKGEIGKSEYAKSNRKPPFFSVADYARRRGKSPYNVQRE